jgi:peptidoglycan/xylan/chitin deacetylase (PgdA/CDA1 family)
MLQQARSAGRHVLARLHDRSPRVLTRLRGRVLILGYHRVLPDSAVGRQFIQPGMYVEEHVFEAHVRFLRENFRIISFTEFLLLQRARAWDPEERYCIITFDDGWLDNYVYAYPILRRYRATATIFVSTALIGSEEWLWPDKLGWLLTRYCLGQGTEAVRERMRALEVGYPWMARLTHARATGQIDAAIEFCKRMSDHAIADLIVEMADRLGVDFPKERLFLEWRDIEEMSRAGIAFGSHAATHRVLTRLSDDEMRAEVAGSVETLRQKPVNWVPVFCYPNGDYNDAVVDQVKASGYRAAVSTEAGAEVWDRPDLFRLRRVGVHNDVSASTPLFAFHLSRVGHL